MGFANGQQGDRFRRAAGAGRFTWEEVAAHNSAESCWVTLEGRVYDITPFLDRHPGGREILLLAAGRECTDLFRSYHWRAEERSRKYLADFDIGALVGPTEHPVFAPDADGFYDDLKARVNAHFVETGKNPKQREAASARARTRTSTLSSSRPPAPSRASAPLHLPLNLAQCGRASGALCCRSRSG